MTDRIEDTVYVLLMHHEDFCPDCIDNMGNDRLCKMSAKKAFTQALKDEYSHGYSDGHEDQMKMRIMDAKEREKR